MAEPLKNIYNRVFFDDFLKDLPEVVPSAFFDKIFSSDWADCALKQRMRRISETLGALLPPDFASAMAALLRCVERKMSSRRSEMNFEYMFIPDFIQIFGINEYQQSIEAIEKVTQFTSCEFAVRPFLIKYGDEMMQQMYRWSCHENSMVRRLASEGMRPILPWAMAVPSLKRDPTPILPILENLKSDSSEFVRRSVANNLNDIAKDFPQIVLDTVGNWRNLSPETDWIIRHGSRTLLKRGNTDSLQSFGFQLVPSVELSDFIIDKTTIPLGGDLIFSFNIKNTATTEGVKIRLEFGIDYMKASGKTARKIFQITERVFAGNEVWTCRKKVSFRDLTTRKHYLGKHAVAIIVNGSEKMILNFELTK